MTVTGVGSWIDKGTWMSMSTPPTFVLLKLKFDFDFSFKLQFQRIWLHGFNPCFNLTPSLMLQIVSTFLRAVSYYTKLRYMQLSPVKKECDAIFL